VNRLLLSARLVERQALRYTPAGLPALDVLLQHDSEVLHEGQARKVSVELKARAMGSVVKPVAALALGEPAQFAGFIGSMRNGRGVVFHILELHIQPGPGSTAALAPESE
jgi:primosomal replication protein N